MGDDRHGPTVFRIEQAFDLCPGYIEVVATISIEVHKTTSAISIDLDIEEATQEKLEPSQDEDQELCKSDKIKSKKSPSKSRHQISFAVNSSVCIGGSKGPEEHENDTPQDQNKKSPTQGEDNLPMTSEDKPTSESGGCRDELIFDLQVYKDRLEERFDSNEYPVIRKYVRDARNGAINMVVDEMVNIEAHILNGHIKTNQSKMKLEEILVDLRKIVGPLRLEPLTYGECKDIRRYLDMAATCASEY
ncbi:hypothetical protein Aperf_G00000108426 [Anoplocephala perfoliata]